MRAIVFSRDRPMQLDLLLTSLERNAPGVFDVNVLYNGIGYEEGYAICSEEHPETTFIAEDGLTYQVRSLLRDGGLVSFFTDDDVLYGETRPIELEDHWICGSLRLGWNTIYCYPLRRYQVVPEGTVWGWEQADGDFAYPMSLDGHVFRSEDLLPLIEGRNFSTPNHLEVMLMKGAKSIGRPMMAGYIESRLVGIPANRVQSDMPNRNGETHPYSVQELNDLYLAGKRIDLDALDFSDIRGAHQEIPLVFR